MKTKKTHIFIYTLDWLRLVTSWMFALDFVDAGGVLGDVHQNDYIEVRVAGKCHESDAIIQFYRWLLLLLEQFHSFCALLP